MPADLSEYPHWQSLVQRHPGYRQLWLEGRFPPPSLKLPGLPVGILALDGHVPNGTIPTGPPRAITHVTTQTRVTRGPGSWLKRLFQSMHVKPPGGGCSGCETLAAKMDLWGVEGCRQHRGEIVDELRVRAAQYGWVAKAKAAIGAMTSGLAFKVNWADPFPGLVDEAIRLAAEEEKKQPTHIPNVEPLQAAVVQQKPAPASLRAGPMPGSSLVRLCHDYGFPSTPTEWYASLGEEMDRNGLAWCQEHQAELPQRLQQEAERAGIVLKTNAAQVLIRMSLRRAVRKGSYRRAP